MEIPDPAHFTAEFTIKRRDDKSFDIELGICMQHDLEEYVEPDLDDPSTFENEHKPYVLDENKLLEWIVRAEEKAAEYRLSAENCIAAVRMGLSYADMYHAQTGEYPDDSITDKPFEADEDLMFIYERLYAMHSFIFFAKEEIEEQRVQGNNLQSR